LTVKKVANTTKDFASRVLWRVLVTACCLLGPCWTVDAQTLSDLASGQIVGNIPFDQQVKTADEIGLKRVRLAFRWYEVETRAGRFDWRKPDAQMALIRKTGMTPIITLFGGNDLYQPRKEKTERPAPYSSEGVKGFSDFAAAVVKRYGQSLNGKDIFYEIWNEPNTKTFWRPLPNPEDYGRLATATCQAVKAVNPTAKIVGLAMEGTPVKQPYFVKDYNLDIYQEWARRVSAPALAQCLDGLSMHPYRKTPETYLDDEVELQHFLSTQWPRAHAPVILNTEWGYVSFGDGGKEQQAVSNLRAMVIGAGLGRITNIYQLTDGGNDPAQQNQTYGLSTFAGELKPSGLALKRLLALVGDYNVERVDAFSQGSFLASLSKGSRKAWIMWSTNPSPAPVPAFLRNGAQISINLISGKEGPIPVDLRDVGPAPVLVVD
jgi:hypothetical protein